MTPATYIIAWLIYLGATFVLYKAFCALTDHWQSPKLKFALRYSLLAIILTPYISNPPELKLAPSILITLFELVFGDPLVALRSAIPLLLVWGLAMLAALASAARESKHKAPVA